MPTRPRHLPRLLSLSTLILGLLLLTLWLASAFYGIAFGFTGSQQLILSRGWLELDYDSSPLVTSYPRGIEFFRNANIGYRNDLWLDPAVLPNSTWHAYAFPLWWLALPLATLGALFTYRTRHRPPGLCKNCTYDLSGLPSNTPCPECGRPNSQSP